MQLISEDWVTTHVHPRDEQGHKKSFGHVLVIAGSEGKAGAAILCARAALHSGCGIVTAIIPKEAVQVLLTEEPALMYLPLESWEELNWSHYDVIAIGPGLGFSTAAKHCLQKVLTEFDGPVVIDADALTMVACFMELLRSNHIVTPHPGELERLMDIQYHEDNRAKYVEDFIQQYPAVIVLKGAASIVAQSQKGLLQNTTGNDGMATAGSGDVLTGIIAAICAQGHPIYDAACLGVYLHGMSGDLAIQDQSKASLVASDLIHYMGKIRLLD
jgi:NAD(P)H-hydrate epimerase